VLRKHTLRSTSEHASSDGKIKAKARNKSEVIKKNIHQEVCKRNNNSERVKLSYHRRSGRRGVVMREAFGVVVDGEGGGGGSGASELWQWFGIGG